MVRAIVNTTNGIEKFEGEIISDNYELTPTFIMDYEDDIIDNSNFVNNEKFLNKLIEISKLHTYGSTRNYCINADTAIFNNNNKTNISPIEKCKTNNEDNISRYLKKQDDIFWKNLFLKKPQTITINTTKWKIQLESTKISNEKKCTGFISKKCTYTYTINIKIIAKLCIYNECNILGGRRTRRKRRTKRKTRSTRTRTMK